MGQRGLELWGPPKPASEPQPRPAQSMRWEKRLEGLGWGGGVVTACASVWGLGNFCGGSGSRDTGFDIKADSRRPQKVCRRTGGRALLSLA